MPTHHDFDYRAEAAFDEREDDLLAELLDADHRTGDHSRGPVDCCPLCDPTAWDYQPAEPSVGVPAGWYHQCEHAFEADPTEDADRNLNCVCGATLHAGCRPDVTVQP